VISSTGGKKGKAQVSPGASEVFERERKGMFGVQGGIDILYFIPFIFADVESVTKIILKQAMPPHTRANGSFVMGGLVGVLRHRF
jgi:hypothetical protein